MIIFQGYFGPFEFLDFFSQTEAKEEHGEFHKRKQGQFPKKGMIFIKKENNDRNGKTCTYLCIQLDSLECEIKLHSIV